MLSISQLSRLTIDRLEAQTTLNSFGSVVKELILNGIDALATKVTVRLDFQSLGIWIKDNGVGIGSEDLPDVGQRHFTSKLGYLSENTSIRTAGFKGEALHSLRSLARVTIISKTEKNSPFVLSNEGVEPFDTFHSTKGAFDIGDLGRSGTVVVATNLFHSTPVRRKQILRVPDSKLLDEVRESLVQTLVRMPELSLKVYIVMSGGDLTLFCNHDGCTGSIYEKYASIIRDVHGFLILPRYECISADYNDYQLHGVVGYLPSQSSAYQYTFINERCSVLLNEPVSTRLELYGSPKKRRNRFPVFLMNFTFAMPDIDLINKHVGSDHKNVISKMVSQVLFKFEELLPKKSSMQYKRIGDGETSPRKLRVNHSLSRSLIEEPQVRKVESLQLAKADFNKFRVIRQIDKKFILIVSDGTVLVADQHACDERIRVEELFEVIIDQIRDPFVVLGRKIEHTMELPLSPRESLLFVQFQKSFEQFGISFWTKDNMLIITHLPFFLANEDANSLKASLLDYLYDLEQLSKLKTLPFGHWSSLIMHLPNFLTQHINSRACRLAVKFGDTLSYEEMTYLMSQLAKCKFPFQCAHGRPSITPLINLNSEINIP
ncbi:uncharacterized protein PRCAT00004747001 [Priceomyces carsonii]|uniref:uncharacterized protein n=1 Tax=Priceomyces carsonii TaxID=28549 RepID=UPI002EDB57F8|nr:unnamed protein product [Priceomyces carsonii]